MAEPPHRPAMRVVLDAPRSHVVAASLGSRCRLHVSSLRTGATSRTWTCGCNSASLWRARTRRGSRTCWMHCGSSRRSPRAVAGWRRQSATAAACRRFAVSPPGASPRSSSTWESGSLPTTRNGATVSVSFRTISVSRPSMRNWSNTRAGPFSAGRMTTTRRIPSAFGRHIWKVSAPTSVFATSTASSIPSST